MLGRTRRIRPPEVAKPRLNVEAKPLIVTWPELVGRHFGPLALAAGSRRHLRQRAGRPGPPLPAPRVAPSCRPSAPHTRTAAREAVARTER